MTALRRLTAISLAIQLYRADHGTWPERLDPLVPSYLKSLPADPFHADGRPIGYLLLKNGLPDGSDRPLLYYDIGDSTDVIIDTDEPMYGWQEEVREDRMYRVVRQYQDVASWSPKVRRFEAEEAERVKEEQRIKDQERLDEIERLKLEKAVDGNPGQPDAPGEQPKKKEDAGPPAEK